ncbi:phosphotyrosine protein phosphatases I [Mytilinidion resinicola]|uniref:Phosphotyrosine protein phosphatases I n=1 Tax=Mytilinidion resinicola TaxID=574789 RepID=A0A6A6Z7L1_9PEZI|nr:phosphotyrosine protein phosphatases I [Mytilinidion resinicola]KAF2817092.1 phosphotyrosine protein phosphatases I [Mytilinidion resinicola]
MQPVSVLFVCLGNICRSPMAEGVFQHIAKPKHGPHHPLINQIDSCGTGAYHIGDGPDSRTMSTLADNGIKSYKHRARKFSTSDFTTFDYIMAMDDDNADHLVRLRKRLLKQNNLEDHELGRVMLFGEFGGRKGEEIADPYYGARNGFEIAYEQVVRMTNGFLKTLEKEAAAAETAASGEKSGL